MVDQLRGAFADSVHLHMVRVAVGAMPVIDRENVGALVAQHGRNSLPRLVDIGLVERCRVLVPVPAGHARVLVSEPDDAVDAERRCRRIGFGAPTIGQRLAVRQIVGDFAVLTVGGNDQNHPVPLGGGAGHRAPGRDALVVRMCVEADQRSHWRECASFFSKTEDYRPVRS